MIRETEIDRKNEREVIEAIHRNWDMSNHFAERFPDKHPLDYAIKECETNRVVTVLEIKSRKIRHNQFPDIFFSFKKWKDLIPYHFMGISPLFFVNCLYDNRIGFINAMDVDLRNHCINGNSRREEINDIELLINVPVEQFTWFTR